jgi:hypothetical protein
VTLAVSVSTGVVVQFADELGPYRLNVIVPPGLKPPDKVAVSFTVVAPAAPVPVVLGAVVMAGEAWPMTTDSSLQPVAAGLLLASPL